jgi:hypothetical protein
MRHGYIEAGAQFVRRRSAGNPSGLTSDEDGEQALQRAPPGRERIGFFEQFGGASIAAPNT